MLLDANEKREKDDNNVELEAETVKVALVVVPHFGLQFVARWEIGNASAEADAKNKKAEDACVGLWPK